MKKIEQPDANETKRFCGKRMGPKQHNRKAE